MAGFFPRPGRYQFPLHPEVRASTEDVEHIVATSVASARNVGSNFSEPRGVLADVRSWDEYVGKSHGYNFDLGLGRIPGARWAHWGPSTYRGGDYTVADDVGMLQPLETIKAFWESGGSLGKRSRQEDTTSGNLLL